LKVIEGSWLAAAALVPLAILPENTILGSLQMPKVFMLRSIAVLMTILVAAEWAIRDPSRGALNQKAILEVLKRPVILAAVAVAAANLIAWAFSPVKVVSAAGVDAGMDSYGLFSLASYLVVFAVVATHLRTRAQVERLVWVLAATSMLLGIYGVGQHFGIDWLVDDPKPENRIALTMGNAIFGAAWMLMVVPLTLALWQSKRDLMSVFTHIWIGAVLVSLPMTAIMFSLSRGPWIGFALSLLVFLVSVAWVFGARAVIRPASSIAVAAAITGLILLLPVSGTPQETTGVTERFITVGTGFTPTDGLSSRYQIWRTAGSVYLNVPWVDTERFTELPELG